MTASKIYFCVKSPTCLAEQEDTVTEDVEMEPNTESTLVRKEHPIVEPKDHFQEKPPQPEEDGEKEWMVMLSWAMAPTEKKLVVVKS
jgi:hypothetical protein